MIALERSVTPLLSAGAHDFGMNVALRTIAVTGAGAVGLCGLIYFGAQSQRAAAERTSAVIAEDRAAQQDTAQANKLLGEKLARKEEVEAAARELAYSQTPEGRELERLRQEDLRAIRESGGKVPSFAQP